MLGAWCVLTLTFSMIPVIGLAASPADVPSSPSSYTDVSESARAKAESNISRIQTLVDQGVLPKKSLDDARTALRDAQDEDVLSHTLYGGSKIQDLSQADAKCMVEAAQRRVDREGKIVGDRMKLVADGVLARSEVQAFEEELQMRKRALDLAHSRAKLLDQLLAMAKAEEAFEQAQASELANLRPVMIRYAGSAQFAVTKDLKKISDAFSIQFHEPLPVSALGQTLVHQELGFDHRGRVDVALNPDAKQGVWLRNFLEQRHVPYIAFRAAVAGSATAPHIHIGPGSTRLKLAPAPDSPVRAAHSQSPRAAAASGT